MAKVEVIKKPIEQVVKLKDIEEAVKATIVYDKLFKIIVLELKLILFTHHCCYFKLLGILQDRTSRMTH